MYITNKQKFLKFIKDYKVKIDFKNNLIYFAIKNQHLLLVFFRLIKNIGL